MICSAKHNRDSTLMTLRMSRMRLAVQTFANQADFHLLPSWKISKVNVLCKTILPLYEYLGWSNFSYITFTHFAWIHFFERNCMLLATMRTHCVYVNVSIHAFTAYVHYQLFHKNSTFIIKFWLQYFRVMTKVPKKSCNFCEIIVN